MTYGPGDTSSSARLLMMHNSISMKKVGMQHTSIGLEQNAGFYERVAAMLRETEEE